MKIGIIGSGDVAQALGTGFLSRGDGIESARYLEPMCLSWIVYGRRARNWRHAFKLLR